MKTESFLRSIVVLSAAIMMTGCGGGVSQHDLLERARNVKRQNDEEEQSRPNVVSPVVATDIASVAGTVDRRAEVKSIDDGEPEPVNSTLPEPVRIDALPPSLSARQQEKQIVENLARLSKALKQFSTSNRNTLPMHARYIGKNPALSWRVELLPLLGHTELYKKFKLDEPWDSDHNLKLLPFIPDVYRSTAVGGVKTTFLVPFGGNTSFQGRKVVGLKRIEDGVANTIFLVNAAGEMAVEWTRPADWEIRGSLVDKVADSESGGFYVAWGNGRISKLRNDLTDTELYALVSIDNGELVSLSDVVAQDVSDEVADLIDMGHADLTKIDAKHAPAAVKRTREPSVDFPTQGMRYEDAVDELADGFQRRAFQIYHSSIVLQKNDDLVLKNYRWVPGLKRPSAGLRFGLAVKSNHYALNANVYPIEVKKNSPYEPVKGPGVQLIDHFCGDLGQRTMRVLIDMEEAGNFGSFVSAETTAGEVARDGKSRRGTSRRVQHVTFNVSDIDEQGFSPVMLYPGIEILGILSRSDAIKTALRREIDVVVLFDVSLKRTSTGEVQNSAKVVLIDPLVNKELYKTNALNNRAIALIRRDPTREDPLIGEMQKFSQLFESLFSPVPFPNMKPHHVDARIARLIDENPGNPLAAMAEIRFYLAKGLISRHHAWQAMRKLNDETETLLPADFDELTCTHLATLVDAEEE